MKPNEIESLSFSIIDEEAGPHNYTEDEWSIVRRMIHTSADFEYKESACIHPRAIEAGVAAILGGRNVVTDTNMARSGIRKHSIESFGGETICLVGDAEVAGRAREKGTTRSREAVDMALESFSGGIYAVGNAPTALLRLIELIGEGKAKPALILGFPVGFVNAAESKALLTELDEVPYITNEGRKGGSNIAAAVMNALIIIAEKRASRA